MRSTLIASHYSTQGIVPPSPTPPVTIRSPGELFVFWDIVTGEHEAAVLNVQRKEGELA